MSILSLKKIYIICAIFIFTFYVKLNSRDNIYGLGEFIKASFYGPNNLSDNIMEVLTWSLCQFYLIYLIGQYLYNELEVRSIYTFLRIRHKKTWHICLQITCFLICVVYFLIGLVIGLITGYVFNIKLDINNIVEVINIFTILVLSSYYIITIYFFSIIKTQAHNRSFLMLIIILYLSIILGSIFKIDKFIPLNQGIISKHFISDFSFRWSYIYLSIMIIINIMVINRLIKKKDFSKIAHN